MTPKIIPNAPTFLTDPKGAATNFTSRPQSHYDLADVDAEVFIRRLAGDVSICLTAAEEDAVCSALDAAGIHGRSLLRTYRDRWPRSEWQSDMDPDARAVLPSFDEAVPVFEAALRKVVCKCCNYCLERFPETAVNPGKRCVTCLGDLARQFVVRRKNAQPSTVKDPAIVQACCAALGVVEGAAPLVVYSIYKHQLDMLPTNIIGYRDYPDKVRQYAGALGHAYEAIRFAARPSSSTKEPPAGPN